MQYRLQLTCFWLYYLKLSFFHTWLFYFSKFCNNIICNNIIPDQCWSFHKIIFFLSSLSGLLLDWNASKVSPVLLNCLVCCFSSKFLVVLQVNTWLLEFIYNVVGITKICWNFFIIRTIVQILTFCAQYCAIRFASARNFS